jgi:serine/threonine protein phosphatase PrpC
MNFTIDIPKKEGLGEDAPPVYMSSADEKRVVVAVFDGLGGAGSTLYEEDGISLTGAYIASREVSNSVSNYFKGLIDEKNFEITPEIISELKIKIRTELEEKLKKQKFEQSKLKSSLIRTFPTTLALAIVNFEAETSEIDILWAGDSRIYILNAVDGLIQLTKDDLKLENDPFENIGNDSPLSNMIHLDDDFTINHLNSKIENPFFVLAATDGCFGYYPTPMHFEHLLLNNLFTSNSEIEWKEKITSELKSISGDDFSLALKYVQNSAESFEEIKKLFRDRLEELHMDYMSDINKSEAEITQLKSKENELQLEISKLEVERKNLYKSLWESYKIKNYPNNKFSDQ